MQERILTMAMSVARAGEEERELMTALCAAEEAAWRGRIRDGIAAEDCGEAFLCAVAAAAAADFLAGCGEAAFTAGEISVKGGGSEQANILRKCAEHLMAPYAVAADFCFKGVQG